MTRLLNQRSANSTRRGFLKTTAAMTLGSAALAGAAGLERKVLKQRQLHPTSQPSHRSPPFPPEHDQAAVGVTRYGVLFVCSKRW
jgi:anaerobic selenocysteine-containing dehydrogenase